MATDITIKKKKIKTKKRDSITTEEVVPEADKIVEELVEITELKPTETTSDKHSYQTD